MFSILIGISGCILSFKTIAQPIEPPPALEHLPTKESSKFDLPSLIIKTPVHSNKGLSTKIFSPDALSSDELSTDNFPSDELSTDNLSSDGLSSDGLSTEALLSGDEFGIVSKSALKSAANRIDISKDRLINDRNHDRTKVGFAKNRDIVSHADFPINQKPSFHKIDQKKLLKTPLNALAGFSVYSTEKSADKSSFKESVEEARTSAFPKANEKKGLVNSDKTQSSHLNLPLSENDFTKPALSQDSKRSFVRLSDHSITTSYNASPTAGEINKSQLTKGQLTQPQLTQTQFTKAHRTQPQLNDSHFPKSTLNEDTSSVYQAAKSDPAENKFSNINIADVQKKVTSTLGGDLIAQNDTERNLDTVVPPYGSQLTVLGEQEQKVQVAGNSSVPIAAAEKTHHYLLAENTFEDIPSANVASANVTSANVTSANVTSANVNSANVNSENVTSENVNSENVTSENVTSANVASENVASENVASENVASENVASENVASEIAISEDSSLHSQSSPQKLPEQMRSKSIPSGIRSAEDVPSENLPSENLPLKKDDSKNELRGKQRTEEEKESVQAGSQAGTLVFEKAQVGEQNPLGVVVTEQTDDPAEKIKKWMKKAGEFYQTFEEWMGWDETSRLQKLDQKCKDAEAAACFNMALTKHREGKLFEAETWYQISCTLKHQLSCERYKKLVSKRESYETKLIEENPDAVRDCEAGVGSSCAKAAYIAAYFGQPGKSDQLNQKACNLGYPAGCMQLARKEQLKGNFEAAKELDQKAKMLLRSH